MGRVFAVVVAIIAIASAAVFALRIWWLPPDISAHGARIDRQLMETMVVCGILFVLAQLALAAFVWTGGAARGVKTFPRGATPMGVLAVVLVGGGILVLTFVGGEGWAGIYPTAPAPHPPQIQTQAEAFSVL